MSHDYVNVKQGLVIDSGLVKKTTNDVPAAIANFNRDLLACPSASLGRFFPPVQTALCLVIPREFVSIGTFACNC